MQTRILPREEWPLLAGTELERVYPHLPPEAQVVVVEDSDTLVGCWAVYPQMHVEGCWIRPEARGSLRVVRRLLMGMVNTALAMGADVVQTAAMEPSVADLLERLGARELPPARHFSLRLRK